MADQRQGEERRRGRRGTPCNDLASVKGDTNIATDNTENLIYKRRRRRKEKKKKKRRRRKRKERIIGSGGTGVILWRHDRFEVLQWERCALLVVELRDDLSREVQAMLFILRQVIRHARLLGMHLCAAEALLVHHFTRRHLHQRRSRQEHLSLVLPEER